MPEALRERVEAALARFWFRPSGGIGDRLVGFALRPLEMLTAAVSGSRRRRILAARSQPHDPPLVIVVGNLVVGGAGKTPLVATIAGELAARGWRCGILSRGYRRRSTEPALVAPGDDADEVGDEPLMLARETGLPVVVGADRRAALELMRDANPDIAVVVSDDGLQHAALPRDIEIAVFDARGAGNRRLLPAGPLREPLTHVRGMDAVVVNGGGSSPVAHPRIFASRLVPVEFVALDDPSHRIPAHRFASHVAGRELLAIAGIASPQRFFDVLDGLGLHSRNVALPDHARIDPALLASRTEELVVMTMKDAVKCDGGIVQGLWALRSVAHCDPSLIDWLEAAVRGQTTA
ncbi:MAG: tetraacyldisaccharide 4'-kinase [Gemmatimonadales bacterium]|jgi:tetraacyldisaccharide 4'-kinase|nr:tetraacyldisaccharide 4'-kinase [Gemmatimonadales bacterium]